MPTPSLTIGQNIPVVLEPRIARSINHLAQEALAYGGNHRAVRSAVGAVLNELTIAARERFGHHNCIDILELRKILHRSDPDGHTTPRATRCDPIEYLCERQKLEPEQFEAATQIREIFTAFGKLFTSAARDYRRAASGAHKPKTPIDLMSAELLNRYHYRFTPWMEQARHRFILSKRKARIATTQIVFFVVLDMMHTHEVDKVLVLKPGLAGTVLLDELTRFSQYEVAA